MSIILVPPVFVSNVCSQASPSYYVTVEPDFLQNAVQYWSIGRIVALSFKALWTYGPNSEQGIQNATATINVTDQNDKAVDTLCTNTANGTFSFNYTSKSPEILAFTPTKLVTQNGQEWNSSLIDSAHNVYGFTYHWMQVWWDTFQASMVNQQVDSSGNVAVSVKITHLLLPESGLMVGPVLVPKIVQGENVTINGIKAEESQTPGIYSANNSAWLNQNSFVVEVSQDYWTTTSTNLSFVANANHAYLIPTPSPTPLTTAVSLTSLLRQPLSTLIIITSIVMILTIAIVLLLINFRKNR